MAIRVLVNGAKGRMGSESAHAVRSDAELQLVAELDLGDDLAAGIQETQAQVVVDFTAPQTAAANTETILRAGAHPVVGTTGFAPEEIARLQALALDLGVGGLIAPNFAIGAVLMMRFAAEAAQYMPHVEIIEMHHDGKAEAPSGTAIKTAELFGWTEWEIKQGLSRVETPGVQVNTATLTEYLQRVYPLRDQY